MIHYKTLTLQLEREILRKVPTLVVTPEQEQGRWMTDFQRPKVQHALDKTESRGLKYIFKK
jgi:hypothetical protein